MACLSHFRAHLRCWLDFVQNDRNTPAIKRRIEVAHTNHEYATNHMSHANSLVPKQQEYLRIRACCLRQQLLHYPLQWYATLAIRLRGMHRLIQVIVVSLRILYRYYVSRRRTKILRMCTPTKTCISLRIFTVWSESSFFVQRIFASLIIKNATSEDADQAAQMRKLIWIFAGRTCPKVHFLTLWHVCQYEVLFFFYL